MAGMINELLQKLNAGQELNAEEAYGMISAIHKDEMSDIQIMSFQVALLMKGPTLIEISAIAKAMRDYCIPITPNVEGELMDTCGTGGGLSTFNISTAVAFVAAAAGIKVAKTGSKSSIHLSGSADVLEALGIQINQSPRSVEKQIEEVGMAFLYAPLFHPVMRKMIHPEKDLGIKTIFYTIIGPLINPARARRHVMGVYKPDLLDIVTQVAVSLDYSRALFVHGEDGMDEISLLGKTKVNELKNGIITSYEIIPEDLGLTRCKLNDIATGTPEANAVMIKDVFSGKNKGPRRQAVILNAAGALMIGDKAESLKDGVKLAKEILDSGLAQNKLNQFIEASHSYKNFEK
ncbi:MAG: anthranilate phosphoribosyltransferase [Herbinix sp.]|jgi:anthranilate phosphoribosyltransferase|nr:anthranilate phosphoribosyltransferase [Herbinix sp.]